MSMKAKRIYPHLIFWLCYVTVNPILISIGNQNLGGLITYFLAILPIMISVAYYVDRIVGSLLNKSTHLIIGVAKILVAILLAFILTIIVDNLLYSYWQDESFWYKSFRNLVTVVVAISQFLAFNFILISVEKDKAMRQLKYARTAAELESLKNQINPHFLFNTLNNLYSLIVNDSEKAAGVVMSLSKMLRYLMVEASAKEVPLEREVELLKQYFELERIRNEKRVTINLEIDVDDNVMIAPLLFLPLAENAFKHGAGSSKDKSWINLSLTTKGKFICFSLENSKKSTVHNGTGIGLSNLRERLKLTYPDKHHLNIKDGNTYLADMTIDTSGDVTIQ